MPEDGKPLVFIIDDDDVFVDVVRHRLHNEGFATERAGSGEEALQMLPGMLEASQKPDAILLDISMPGMNGIETLEKLHADQKLAGIPVALLSNFSRGADEAWAGKIGAIETIDKTSVLPTDIPDIVRKLLGK